MNLTFSTKSLNSVVAAAFARKFNKSHLSTNTELLDVRTKTKQDLDFVETHLDQFEEFIDRVSQNSLMSLQVPQDSLNTLLKR